MIETSHDLDETAQEPVGRAASEAQKPLSIQRGSPFPVEFKRLHRRVGDMALATGTLHTLCEACFPDEGAALAQPRPFEAGIGI